MNLKRRLPQYAIGLIVLALGSVLVKKADTGISPISSTPSALSNITPLSFGTTTAIFHVFCFILILLVQRKIDLKTILILPVAVVFGMITDLWMFLLAFGDMPLPLRYVLTLIGIVVTALGVVIIVGSDLMLPAPDAFPRTVSKLYNQPLSRMKIAADALWVVIAIIVELTFCHKIVSVWIGTLLAVFLTGKLVGVYSKYFPWIFMEPCEIGKPGGKSEASDTLDQSVEKE